MEPYIYKRNKEGIHIMNLGKTWEKLMLAARVIAAIPNPKDILVSSFLRIKALVLITECFSHIGPVVGYVGEHSFYRLFQANNTLKEPFLSSELTQNAVIWQESGPQVHLLTKTQRSNDKSIFFFLLFAESFKINY